MNIIRKSKQRQYENQEFYLNCEKNWKSEIDN